MRFKYLPILAAGILCLVSGGCTPTPPEGQTKVEELRIVEIYGCEYLEFHTYYHKSITHKGNCKYCIARAEKSNK